MLSLTMSHLLKLNFSHGCDYYTVAASCCTHRKSVCFLCKHTGLLAHFMWYRQNTGKNLFDAICQLHPWYIWLSFYMMTLYLHIKQFICLRREKALLIPSKHMESPNDICHIWEEWSPQPHCCANLKTQFHVQYIYGLYIGLDNFWLYNILDLAFRCQSEWVLKKAVWL